MTPTPPSPPPSRSERPAPRVALIAAVAAGGVIGAGNALPWHLPADLRRFRELTWGHPIVMGRRTFASLGRPLPGRANIVVSRDPEFAANGIQVARSPEAALAAASALDGDWVFVIGGAEIYAQCLARADCIYLTRLDLAVAGDAFFPELDPRDWTETAREEHPAAGERPAYAFVTLERRPAAGRGAERAHQPAG
jgi:dihydrofolate reductase